MAYFDGAADRAAAFAVRPMASAIRLGEAERRVILKARRDAQTGRPGGAIADPRLDALRHYVRRGGSCAPDAGAPLLAAGFSATERRIVDAMIDALPARAGARKPATGRLVAAAFILVPLLAAMGAYGWAGLYIQDRLIGLVLSGLALVMVLPVVSTLASPAPRQRPAANYPRK